MNQQAVISHPMHSAEYAFPRGSRSWCVPEEVFGCVFGNEAVSANGTINPRLERSKLSDELAPYSPSKYPTDLVDG